PSRRPLFPSRGILAYRSGPGLFQGRRSGFLRIRFYLAARIGGHLVLARRFGQIHSLYYPPARHRRRYLPLRGVTALIPLGPQQTALRVIEQPFPVQKAALVAGLLPGLAVVPIVLPRSRALAPGEAAFGRDLPVRVPFAQVHGHALPVHHHRTQGTIGPIHPELPVGPAVAETLPVGQAAQAVVGEALAGPGIETGALAQAAGLIPGVGAVMLPASRVPGFRGFASARMVGYPEPVLASPGVEGAPLDYPALRILFRISPGGNPFEAGIILHHGLVPMVG